MERFIQKYGEKVTDVLSGFDRRGLRGTLRDLAEVNPFAYLQDTLTHSTRTRPTVCVLSPPSANGRSTSMSPQPAA